MPFCRHCNTQCIGATCSRCEPPYIALNNDNELFGKFFDEATVMLPCCRKTIQFGRLRANILKQRIKYGLPKCPCCDRQFDPISLSEVPMRYPTPTVPRGANLPGRRGQPSDMKGNHESFAPNFGGRPPQSAYAGPNSLQSATAIPPVPPDIEVLDDNNEPFSQPECSESTQLPDTFCVRMPRRELTEMEAAGVIQTAWRTYIRNRPICTICRNPFTQQYNNRVSPFHCKQHCFHDDCADGWQASCVAAGLDFTCPVCRSTVISQGLQQPRGGSVPRHAPPPHAAPLPTRATESRRRNYCLNSECFCCICIVLLIAGAITFIYFAVVERKD